MRSWRLQEEEKISGNSQLQGMNGVDFGENKSCKAPVLWEKIRFGRKCLPVKGGGKKRTFLRWHFLGMEDARFVQSWMELTPSLVQGDGLIGKILSFAILELFPVRISPRPHN